MRSHRTAALASALAFLAVSATAGAAEPVSEELKMLKQMEERLLQMEDRLAATTAQLDAAEDEVEAQSEMLEQAGLLEGRGESNGVTEFLNEIDFGGFVSASYAYNFNGADGSFLGGANTGTVAAYPFHPDSNSFSIDQFWIEMERGVDEENRAGFRIDLSYGKSPGLLADAGGTVGNGGDGFSGNDFNLYSAYVQYLAPIGNGVTFQLGKFGTLIGAEVMASPYNFNVSRGHVYNLIQPFTHSGILASTEIGGLSIAVGGINETRSFDARDVDLGNGKALLWSLGYGLGDVGLSFAGAYGAADSGGSFNGNSGDDELILDVILSWDPTDNFSTYINADYILTENVQPDASGFDDIEGFGIAWAGRYGITERTGVALRAEYVQLDSFFAADQDLEIWGITGTVDHLLTDTLMLRGEIRYDQGDDDAGDNIFIDNGPVPEEDDQVVLLLEAIYKFDGFGG